MEPVNLEGDAYYEDTTIVSRSMLDDFIEDPPLFHGRYVTKVLPKRKATAALKFGIAFHEFNLEGGLKRTAVMPEISGKGSTERKKEWEAEHSDMNVIDEDDHAAIIEMRNAMSAPQNAVASAMMFGPGENEVTTTFELFGLKMKARLDRVICSGTRGIIPDLKSNGGPTNRTEWAREVYNRGYHRQAFIYLEAAKARYPEIEQWIFGHVVQSKAAPYSAYWFELPQGWIELGERQVRSAIEWLHECRRTGVWVSRDAAEPIMLDDPAPWMK